MTVTAAKVVNIRLSMAACEALKHPTNLVDLLFSKELLA